MIKALISDVGRVLLFAKDPSYTGLLNDLHDEHVSEEQYNFWDYFVLNEELLQFYDTLKDSISLSIFTTGHIQEHLEFAMRLNTVFELTFSAEHLHLDKCTPNAYETITDLLELEPSEILLVDDTVTKIEAAQKVGWRGVTFKNTEQAIEDIQRELNSLQ